MADLIQNANPKHNPWTTVIGFIFLLIGAAMYLIEYVLQDIIQFKSASRIVYEWWQGPLVLFIGLVLMFMTDQLFTKLFSLVVTFFRKITGISDIKDQDDKQ